MSDKPEFKTQGQYDTWHDAHVCVNCSGQFESLSDNYMCAECEAVSHE